MWLGCLLCFFHGFLYNQSRSPVFSLCLLLCRTGVWQRSDLPSVWMMPKAFSIHATQRALPVTSRMFPFFLNHISSLAHFLFSGLASRYSRHHLTFYLLSPTKPLDYLAYKAGSSLHRWLKAHFYSTCYWAEQMCGQDTSGLSQLDGPFLKLIFFWIYTINPYFSLTLIFLWLPQLSWLFSFS